MTRFVIDPPTLLAIARGEVEVSPEHRLVAPNALRSQALQLLYAAVRRGELTTAAARALHHRSTEVRVRLLGDRMSRWTAWQIAEELGLDDLGAAEYLAVCRLQADALVSVDPAVRQRAAPVVPVADVEDLSR